VQARTGPGMTPERTAIPLLGAIRSAVLITLPLMAMGLLRQFPPLSLASADGELARWLSPLGMGMVALVGAFATVVALISAFRSQGTLNDLLEAGGLGSLTAAAASVALIGPDGSAALPTPILGVGLLGAGVALVAAEVLPPIQLAGRGVRLATTALVFGWIEAAPAMSLLGVPSAVWTSPLAAVGGALLGVAGASALVGGQAGRAIWLALLAAGATVLALGRAGTADLLPAVAALAAAVAGAAAARATAAVEPIAAEPETLRPLALIGQGTAPAEAHSPHAEEALRLARELRGTISELLAARQTVELQRQELSQLSLIDPVSGVTSRRAILDRLRAEAAEARRYAHPLCLALIDVDGMAALNRESGIDSGDALLREIALRLRLRMREADAVGRLGGDTFLAILPHTDERGATVFADAVRTRLTASPVDTDTGPVSVTLSIGITVVRAGDDYADGELLGRAEEALASARAAGGNRIAFDRNHGLARVQERRSRGQNQKGSKGSAPGA
jgi:diguanylate cyclase (GGDEF)-like protein